MSKMIFEPITINGMELKNRIGLAPLLNMPRGPDWGVSEQTIKWFEERAKGGTGFLMTGAIVPPVMLSPDAVERFAKLSDMVHSYGAKIGVQITGMGGAFLGLGPSASPFPNENDPRKNMFEIMKMELPPIQAMSVEQIKEQVEQISTAAAALKDAGVDCVELHCAHGGATLLCSFISPFYNRRTDDYGGSWENRLRFPVETIKKMREKVGKDYPLLVRISASELIGSDGITLEDSVKYTVPAMEEAGVDCFDVSQGSITHAPEGIEIPLYYPRGCFINHAEAVKKTTKLPVIGVGRIVDLDMAEDFLQEGKADIIYMGRQLTSDPDTPNKYLEGRSDEIRKCIGCLEGCGTPCPINYDILPDAKPLTPAEKAKKVLVVGGGVAGMEAARVSALRGHQVTLVEKRTSLGGIIADLSIDPLYTEFGNFTDYLTIQMEKLGIDVKLSNEYGPDEVNELKPDAVIVATGSSMIIPKLVKGKSGVMDHMEAMTNKEKIGNKVVIWGLAYGAELAISLANDGKDVTLIGESDEKTLNAHTESSPRKWWAMRKLSDVNVVRAESEAKMLDNPKVLFNIKLDNITDEGVTIKDKNGAESLISFDTFIVSRGRNRNNSLFETLKDKMPEIYQIGDSANIANILGAVWSANETARKI